MVNKTDTSAEAEAQSLRDPKGAPTETAVLRREWEDYKARAEAAEAEVAAIRAELSPPDKWPTVMAARAAKDAADRADLCDPLRDERVRALAEALEAVVFAAEAHDETGDMMQEYWLDDALAALRAIKEPKPR